MKHIILIYLCLIFIPITGFAQVDSLSKALENAAPQDKTAIYLALGDEYFGDNWEKHQEWNLKALASAQKFKQNKLMVSAQHQLGIYHYAQQDYQQAADNMLQAVKVANHLEADLEIADLLRDLSSAYKFLGEYDQSQKYALQSLDMFKSLQDTINIIGMLLFVGNVQADLDFVDKSEDYYQEALEYAQQSNNRLAEAKVYNNMGLIYSRFKKYEPALSAYKNALKIKEAFFEGKPQKTIALTLGNIGGVYQKKQDFVNALRYHQKAMQAFIEVDYTMGQIMSNVSLGQVYRDLENYNQAELHLQQALEASLEMHTLPLSRKIYQSLAKLYVQQEDYKKAYEYEKKHIEVKDSILAADQRKYIRELQEKYDLTAREQEIEILNKDNQIIKLENKTQRNLKMVYLMSAIFILLVLLLLFNRYLIKQKTNKVLTTKNDQISLALQEKELLLKEIHHRVKNNLQIIASLLNLDKELRNEEDSRKLLQMSQDKIQTMAIIHEKIYQTDNLAAINLKVYLENLLEYFRQTYALKERNIQLQSQIEEIQLDMDVLVPCGLIVNELIANAVKYAFPNHQQGVINLSATQKDQSCTIELRDDGIGLPDDFKQENATSLGLRLIQGLSEQINGVAEFFSDQGTHFRLTFVNKPTP